MTADRLSDQINLESFIDWVPSSPPG